MGSGQNGVEDRELAEEIILLGELMAAAAEQDRHLSQGQIDEALGVRRPPVDGAAGGQGRAGCDARAREA